MPDFSEQLIGSLLNIMRKLKGIILQEKEDDNIKRQQEQGVKAAEVTGEVLRDYLNNAGRRQVFDVAHYIGFNDISWLARQGYDFAVIHKNLRTRPEGSDVEVDQDGFELTRRIIDAGIKMPIIFTGDILKENLVKTFSPDDYRKKHILEVISRKESDPREYKDAIKSAILEHVRTPLRIGLISLGRLNQKILEILFKEHRDYIEEVGGISLTGQHKEQDIRRGLDINDPHFVMHPTLDSMIAANYDLVINSSSAKAASRVEPGRNWLWETEKTTQLNEWRRISELEQKKRDSGIEPATLYAVATNPIGPIMYLANQLGIQAENLTGLSVAGRKRFIDWIKKIYHDKHNEWLDDARIEAEVLGPHGMEFPLAETVKIRDKDGNWKTAEECGMPMINGESRKYLREEGGRIMDAIATLSAADQYEALYRGVPEATVALIEGMTLRKQPKGLIYAITERGAFNTSANFTYSTSGIKVSVPREERYQRFNMSQEYSMYVEENMRESTFQKDSVKALLGASSEPQKKEKTTNKN